MAPYVRTVKTASGATAVQIVHSSRRGSRDIEHIGSVRDDPQLEILKAAARQRIAGRQGELDLLEHVGRDTDGNQRGEAGRPPAAGPGVPGFRAELGTRTPRQVSYVCSWIPLVVRRGQRIRGREGCPAGRREAVGALELAGHVALIGEASVDGDLGKR